MKKLAILAIVLLTTSCAVSEEIPTNQFEQEASSSPDSNQSVESDQPLPDSADLESEAGEQEQPSTEVDEQETEAQPTQPNEATNQPESSETVDSPALGEETVNGYINQLTVRAEVTSGYDRDLFRHWVDADRDGCHAREETLIAESVGQVSVSGDCDIRGSWFSAFDGETTTNPSNFDVDHMVPLKEAWDSGANNWSSSTRERFANDLGSPHSLIAVSRSSNRSKGASDPAEWMPPRQDYWCEYVFSWTLVKIRWSLSADPAEISALRDYGGDCLISEMDFDVSISEADIVTAPPAPEPTPEPAPEPEQESTAGGSSEDELDPRFRTCGLAKENGFGPYVEGIDPEYEWYRDGDNDGTVCE